MSTRRMQVSALLAIGLVAAAALRAHGAPTVIQPGEAQPRQLRRAEPAPSPPPAATAPDLQAQVTELRAQLDSLRKVLSVDADGNVTLRADRNLLLKAGSVLEARAGSDAKLIGAGRVVLRGDQLLEAEGKAGLTLRSAATLDARAALIKLN